MIEWPRRAVLANYSFYMGVGSANIDGLLRTDPRTVCGLKAFLGSSTGDMVITDEHVLDEVFSKAHMLLAVHAEDDPMIKQEMERAVARYGADIPMEEHPQSAVLRLASSRVVLPFNGPGISGRACMCCISARKKRLQLFEPGPLEGKRNYCRGLCAPLVVHRCGLRQQGRTDQVEPGSEDRSGPGRRATSRERRAHRRGGHGPRPSYHRGKSPSLCAVPLGCSARTAFLGGHVGTGATGGVHAGTGGGSKCATHRRACSTWTAAVTSGEGHFADLVLVDLIAPWKVTKDNLLYKCGWSPLEGETFQARVARTWVNGRLVYNGSTVDTSVRGERLLFAR